MPENRNARKMPNPWWEGCTQMLITREVSKKQEFEDLENVVVTTISERTEEYMLINIFNFCVTGRLH